MSGERPDTTGDATPATQPDPLPDPGGSMMVSVGFFLVVVASIGAVMSMGLLDDPSTHRSDRSAPSATDEPE